MNWARKVAGITHDKFQVWTNFGPLLPFISVDYDEGHPETYRGVTLFDNQGTITFSGLGFESDLRRAEKCIKGNGFESYLHSSSLDSFIQDQKRNLP